MVFGNKQLTYKKSSIYTYKKPIQIWYKYIVQLITFRKGGISFKKSM